VNAFGYVRPESVDAAREAGARAGARYVGGGTNLLDLVKSDVEHPSLLVDVNRLPLQKIEELPDGALRLGALARNSDVAADARVRARYPLVTQALVAGASGQIRNMATVGGNLLQRTRCHYFVDPGFRACNKREPGSGCAAIGGRNRIHAILGASAQCIAVHPSDFCVALAALDAVVQVRGPHGARAIAFADFHRLPGEHPEKDTALEPGELIVAVDLPRDGFARHFHYLKLRDRASFAFALVAVAAALEIEDGAIKQARIALGGVAHKPWRATAVEEALRGAKPGRGAFERAAQAAVADARGQGDNDFKLALVPRAIVRALEIAASVA
jgi:xanthine dehydrogenase YagS FAD-binding subunit